MTPRRRRAARSHLLLLAALTGLLVAALGLVLPGSGTTGRATAAALPPGVTDSAVTVPGDAAFPDLRFTVGQTKNLVNQVVTVSWTGAAPTAPATGTFALNYLQIMQCWGDSARGPDRAQCAFGGNAAFDSRGGDFTAGRQLNYGNLVDPAEQLKLGAQQNTLYAPFTSVTGKTVSSNANEFYDSSTTNEIAYGRTGKDGTGQQFFEMHTDRENQGLGCGAPDGTAAKAPRSCWLVVVPRGDHEVDGSVRTGTPTNRLESSPLSASNWAHRLAVPLTFESVGDVCTLGGKERPTIGVENAAEAIGRWQPTLCAHGGATFGYSQVGDSVAERQLLSDAPGLAFVDRPLPEGSVPADHPIAYAPVALSGLTLSFVIESQTAKDAPEELRLKDGSRVTTLNLTPRLVAKLVTQSYSQGVNPSVRYLKDNPPDLTRDPDFLAVNPDFAHLTFRGIGDVILPAGLSEANHRLWEWIAADNDARDFVAGLPDPNGMRVNPFFHGLSIPRDDFPKLDPYCQTFTTGPAPLCTLDAHPYADSRHVGTRAVSRGDTLSRSAWDPNAIPPSYKKSPPQPGGSRALIAFSDTTTSERYATLTARLRNAAGEFVAPDRAGLLAGLREMRAAAGGVLVPDFTSQAKDAYPLTALTYAATAPAQLSAVEGADYANLLLYAVGAGQKPGVEPGTLPAGFVPLPEALRAPARALALQLRAPHALPSPSTAGAAPTARVGATPSVALPAVPAAPARAATSTVGAAAAPRPAVAPPAPAPVPAQGAPNGSAPTGSGPNAGLAPAAPPAPAPPGTAAAFAQVATVARTPGDTPGASRYAFVAALLLGGLAALAARVLPRLAGGTAYTVLPPGATAPPQLDGDSPRTAPGRPGISQGSHRTSEGKTT